MDLRSSTKTVFVDEHFRSLTYTAEKFKDLEFENCAFEKCIFIECEFHSCRFTDCIFTGCSISAIKPTNSKFSNVSIKDSKVMGFDWSKSKGIHKLVFERCDLRYSNFSYLKLHDLKIIECRATEVSFNESDLTGGVFTKTDFSQSIFSNTNLSKTDFRKAINYGIDFNFNNLKKAMFSLPEAASLLKSLDIVLEG